MQWFSFLSPWENRSHQKSICIVFYLHIYMVFVLMLCVCLEPAAEHTGLRSCPPCYSRPPLPLDPMPSPTQGAYLHLSLDFLILSGRQANLPSSLKHPFDHKHPSRYTHTLGLPSLFDPLQHVLAVHTLYCFHRLPFHVLLRFSNLHAIPSTEE